METGFVFQWPMVLYFLCALAYFEAMRRLDRYWSNRTPLTDEERLWNHARQEEISELEVFERAACGWNLGPEKAKIDFYRYLKSGAIPFYVRDYLRKLPRWHA